MCHGVTSQPSAKSREVFSRAMLFRDGNGTGLLVHFHTRLSSYMSASPPGSINIPRSRLNSSNLQVSSFPISVKYLSRVEGKNRSNECAISQYFDPSILDIKRKARTIAKRVKAYSYKLKNVFFSLSSMSSYHNVKFFL